MQTIKNVRTSDKSHDVRAFLLGIAKGKAPFAEVWARSPRNRGLHAGGFVLAYADHAVELIFSAVGVRDIAFEGAERERIIAVDDEGVDGHIKDLIYSESDVHKSESCLVGDVPFFRLFLAVLMRKDDGRHMIGLVFEPDDVFVVLMLVYGLVSCEVEGEILLLAVDFDLAHRGQPIVVRAEGIEALVVVDYADGALVCGVVLAVDFDVACCFEEVLLAVQRVAI